MVTPFLRACPQIRHLRGFRHFHVRNRFSWYLLHSGYGTGFFRLHRVSVALCNVPSRQKKQFRNHSDTTGWLLFSAHSPCPVQFLLREKMCSLGALCIMMVLIQTVMRFQQRPSCHYTPIVVFTQTIIRFHQRPLCLHTPVMGFVQTITGALQRPLCRHTPVVVFMQSITGAFQRPSCFPMPCWSSHSPFSCPHRDQ